MISTPQSSRILGCSGPVNQDEIELVMADIDAHAGHRVSGWVTLVGAHPLGGGCRPHDTTRLEAGPVVAPRREPNSFVRWTSTS